MSSNLLPLLCFVPMLVILIPTSQVASQATVNVSDFPGAYSTSRLAYYRWREWIESRPAVVKKVPPIPKIISSDVTAVTNLTLDFFPLSILKVDQAEQTFTVLGNFEISWADPALDVRQDGVLDQIAEGDASLLPEMVLIPSRSLWLPSVGTSEGVDVVNLMTLATDTDVLIWQNGSATLYIAAAFTFSCGFDMSKYPYDEHHCAVHFFDMTQNNLLSSTKPWDRELAKNFLIDGEWELLDVLKASYDMRGQFMSKFTLHLRRKTTFYSVMVLLPLVMTSYLNVLVFLLPPDLGDKASYLVTVTISLSVFSSFFNQDMPRGLDSVPTIFYFYIFVLAGSFLSLLMSLFVLRKYKAEQGRQQSDLPEVGRNVTSGDLNKNRVSPAFPEKGNTSKVKKSGCLPCLSVAQMELVFFFLSLIGNSIGIVLILGNLCR